MTTPTIDQIRKMATPSRLAVAIGKKVTGFDFELFYWLQYAEQRILDALMDPAERFIILNVPPRSGKSTYSGVFLPSWFLGMFPSMRVMFVTYSDDYCLAPETPVLTEALEWVPVGSLVVGDKIIGFDEDQGAGGGHCRQWRSAEVTRSARRMLPSYRVTLEDGTQTIASQEHQWLVTNKESNHNKWVTTQQLAARQEMKWPQYRAVRCFTPWTEDQSRDAGYLAGIFDGEGWMVSNGKGVRVYMGQNPGVVLHETEMALKRLGFDCIIRKQHQTGNNVQALQIAGGTAETIRFLGTIRPGRLLDKWQALGAGDRIGKFQKQERVQIVNVEFIGEQEVVALGTSTNTFVADGFAHHNSVKYGRAVRTILDRFGREYFGVGIDKSAQSASDWQMSNSFGGMLSTGVGGILTGYGGDLIIIDDILKNIQEARSQATKRMHEDWYDTTLRSRLHPGGTIIITATRWAEDDLSGVLIERMRKPGYAGDQWEVLDFPALAEPRDTEMDIDEDEWRDELGRAIGESLEPKRYTTEQYETIKNGGMDSFLWSCLYQQRPTTPEGGMFPRACWMYWNEQTIPQIRRTVRVWDLATTEGGGDYTVGVKMGIGINGDLYVLDRQRFQRSTSDVEQAVLAASVTDGYGVKIMIEQERAGAGKTVVENYQRKLAGFLVLPAKADGSKEQRATPYSAMQQNRRVWLPESADWLEEWRREHQGMLGDGRRPRHDDQIDTAAYAARELLGQGAVSMWIPGQGDGWLTREGQMRALVGEPVFRRS